MITKIINSFVSNHITDIVKLHPGLDGLDNYLIAHFARLSHTTKMEYEQILNIANNSANNSANYSDPKCLSYLQQRTADYNLRLSLLQTLSRKGVTAVETLLKT
ncbi:type III secretion system inner rod subunit SctI [Arsenophonus nasoniae]|uniref:type III secretion system inner rod subunit SctI n=1 Tax=Arsenophonus nasoniae TaxID=638 RepID=UPI0038798494